MIGTMPGTIYFGDCLEVLKHVPSESVQLIYVDVPFGTQSVQRLQTKQSFPSALGSQGFGGRRYAHQVVSDMAYTDVYDNYINDFIGPALTEARRVLKRTGTLYLHCDWRNVHYVKVFLDGLFGRDCFLNHIIWSFNYGGRGKRCFPRKHNDILVYTKEADAHVFNWDDIDKVPYKAPGLQKDPARAAAGQVPTDVWEMTIVPTNSKERTGYPTQKPLRLVERAIRASSNPGDTVMDFCAGSGTTCVAAHRLGREFVGIDNSESAIEVMKKRFEQEGISDVQFITSLPAKDGSVEETYALYVERENGSLSMMGPEGTRDSMERVARCWQSELPLDTTTRYVVRRKE